MKYIDYFKGFEGEGAVIIEVIDESNVLVKMEIWEGYFSDIYQRNVKEYSQYDTFTKDYFETKLWDYDESNPYFIANVKAAYNTLMKFFINMDENAKRIKLDILEIFMYAIKNNLKVGVWSE